MKRTTAALALIASLTASIAEAAMIRKETEGTVVQVMEDLRQTMADADPTLFAGLDDPEPAGTELDNAALLVFGVPSEGASAARNHGHVTLFLPLRVLVHTDEEGRTWLAYDEVEAIFDGLDLDLEAAYLERMSSAIRGLVDVLAD